MLTKCRLTVDSYVDILTLNITYIF